MREPLIGIWWYTNEQDLISLRQRVNWGKNIGIWRNAPFIHKTAVELAVPHQSKYYNKDFSKFIKGWVIYNTAINRYFILSDDDELLKDKNFREAVIKDFHLENQSCEFEKYSNFSNYLIF